MEQEEGSRARGGNSILINPPVATTTMCMVDN